MNMTKQEKEILELIKGNQVYADYFLQKVSDIKWFNILENEGFFSPKTAPGPQQIDHEGGWIIPYWNVLDYLERISKQVTEPGKEKYVDDLLSIIKNVTKYHIDNNKLLDNYKTWWGFVKILCNIPNKKIDQDIINLIPYWLDSKFDNSLPALEILNCLLPKLLDSKNDGDFEKAEIIFNYITELTYKKSITTVDPYFLFNSFIKKGLAKKFGEKCSKDVILSLATKLNDVLEVERKSRDLPPFTESSYDFSYIWFNSMFTTPTYIQNDVKQLFVLILREILFTKAGGDEETTRELLETFLGKNYAYPIFKRLVLYIISSYWGKYNDTFWKTLEKEPKFFNNLHYMSEICRILQTFSQEEKKKFKNISGEEYIRKCREYNPYYILRIGLPPLTKEKISTMPNEELAKYLKTPISNWPWKGLALSGLSKALEQAAKDNPEKFVENLEPFLEKEYIYVYSILSGIKIALKDKKIVNEEKLLDFIEKYIEKEEFWKDKYRMNKNPWNTNHLLVISVIGELLKLFNKNVDRLLFVTLGILDKILKTGIREELNDTDYFYIASNSALGIVLSSMIELVSKLEKGGKEKREFLQKYEEILSKEIIEGYVWFGHYLLTFYHIDKNWTKDKVKQLLKQKEELWEAFAVGYFFNLNFNEKIYYLMKAHYKKALKYSFQRQKTEELLIYHICIAYLKGFEELNNNGWLAKILKKWGIAKISKLINCFFMNKQNRGVEEKVIKFWRWIYDNKFKNKKENNLNEDDKKILANLCYLVEFLPEITEEYYKWLKLSVKFIYLDIRLSLFISALNKIKDKGKSIEFIGDIYLEMLKKVTPDFDEENIKLIIDFLYEKGNKQKADEICKVYAKRGFFFLNPIYNKYNPIERL